MRPDEIDALVATLAAPLRSEKGPLLVLLHAVQDAIGHIPAPAVAAVARELNLSQADVHGVVTFYHHFRRTPPGRHVARLCRAEACQAAGGGALESHVARRLGIAIPDTTADGQFTLEPVYCLGLCALGPALMIDGEVYGRVTPARFDALAEEWSRR